MWWGACNIPQGLPGRAGEMSAVSRDGVVALVGFVLDGFRGFLFPDGGRNVSF